LIFHLAIKYIGMHALHNSFFLMNLQSFKTILKLHIL